ncbi:MAG: LamG domain-containing protein [Armatimonadetes bacterium]|nr:LamG domain-containing protein [Armatimonadota bacterium]
MNRAPALLHHWPLATDARDLTGACHGEPQGVHFGVDGPSGLGAARFDGRSATISFSQAGRLPATGDFTLCLRVRPAATLDDPAGEFFSQWDAVNRCGLQVGLLAHSGVTCAQPNGRQLYAGLDSGTVPQVRPLGRPGNAVYVMGLCSHEGGLYAATYEAGAGEVGHVYRHDGTTWHDCGFPGQANAVAGIAVCNGSLYAGSCRYDAGGSALDASTNQSPGGRVYRYQGGSEWVDCGELPGAAEVLALCVWRDELYAIPLYTAGVFKYDGAMGWVDCGVPGNRRAFAIGVHHGHLYVASNAGPVDAPRETWRSAVFRYEGGQSWTDCGPQGDNTQTYSLVTWQGVLHAGTWPDGSLWRHEGGAEWSNAGRLGNERELMPAMVYNGALYAGTLPLGQLWRYEDNARWSLVARLDQTPNVKYRRLWSMAVHRGELCCGMLPSGEVHTVRAGACVSDSAELGGGWQHLAVTRRGDELALYLNGVCRGTSTGADLDLTSDAPLHLGFGQHDFFAGDLADVRIYDGALDDDGIRQLAHD